ncbi:MAG: carbohydrate ABC transporter permease [Planctomycetota bacterium]
MTTSMMNSGPTVRPDAHGGTAIVSAALNDTRRVRLRRTQVVYQAFAYVLLVVGGVLMLTPFGILLSNSLMSAREASQPGVLLPADPMWSNFPRALAQMDFVNALANTTFVTFFAVVLQVLTCSLVGLGFARFRFRGRGATFAVMMATMMIPLQVTMIPVFLLFRSLGMVDTFWPLILQALIGSPFFIFMFRQFFLQIPEDLLEAAKIDGASAFAIYWRLMLPLSTPVIAIVAIYTFMFTWNDFLGPLIYLNSPEKRTLAVALNAFGGQYGVEYKNLLMAASFVTMLPCIVLFFAAQRYFMDTGASSGLKG